MMSTVCPAWAHTCQTMCLGFQTGQLRPEAFRLLGRKIAMLRTCRKTAGLPGIEFPGWRLFTEGGLKRNINGTEIACWSVAVLPPGNFVRVVGGPVVCDPQVLAFLGPTSMQQQHR